MIKRILVTGAGGAAAHNFIQSLRHNPQDEEFHIVGCDTSKYHLELSPVDARYIVPPVSDPKYVNVLNTIIKKERIDFLHPQPDPEVAFIAEHFQEFDARTFLPDKKVIQTCQNKMEFHQLLNDHNISVPETYRISSKETLEDAISTLMKTHEKVWVRAKRGAGSKAALPVKNVEHARMWIEYWMEMRGLAYEDFMVSEFLPGKEYAFQSLWSDGSMFMAQARERVEYLFGNLFPSGQSSTPSVARTVRIPSLTKLVQKAVRTIDPNATGIFCADIKTDKNGSLKITEINAGRFFTTSNFFSTAGVNMPYYYVKRAAGEKVPHMIDKLEPDLFWVRMIDMGYKLIPHDTWSSIKIEIDTKA